MTFSIKIEKLITWNSGGHTEIGYCDEMLLDDPLKKAQFVSISTISHFAVNQFWSFDL